MLGETDGFGVQVNRAIVWFVRDRLRAIGLGLLIVGLALLVFKMWQVASTMRSLQGRVTQAQSLARSSSLNLDLAQIEALVQGARSDVLSLRSDLGPLLWLAPKLGWLPGIGGDVQAAPALLEMADGLTEAGVLMWQSLSPLATSWNVSGQAHDPGMIQKALAQLAASRPPLERAKAALERAANARASLQMDRLSARFAGPARKLDAVMPLAQTGVDLALGAPEVLGLDGPRTYLILALNEDELRPGGGFITGVGEVRLEAGRLVKMSFRDSYAVDDFTRPYPDPPEPLYRFMGIDQWVLRDSNWSSDFPTTAQQAISLYRPGYPVSVEGVIAVDQQAVQGLAGALGPLTVEGVKEPLTGETIIAHIRRAWAPEDGTLSGEWWSKRKSFMGPLAEAAWKRVESGQVDWSTLAQALVRLLDEKHLLIYLQNAEAASALAQQGWDGALRTGSGDFLMVVDANLGYNKASARIQQAIAYQVDLGQLNPQVTLTLTYTHTSVVDYPCRPEIHYDPVYEQMMDRCYWDYIQVHVPLGSRLLDATRLPLPGSLFISGKPDSGEVIVQPAAEGPWLSMGVISVLPTASTQNRFIRWTLPAGVVRWQGSQSWYILRVQKQPGTRGHPLTVRIRLPEGGSLLDVTPGAQAVEGQWVIYQTTLERDRTFQLHFRRQP